MVRCLSIVAIIGALFCASVWLAALIKYVESDIGGCQTFLRPPGSSSSSPDVLYAATHILPLPVFIALSLSFTAVFFALLLFQLLQHDRLAREVLLEDLAETAATQHASGYCASCTSFTHTLLLLFNSITCLLLAVLCVLGVGSISAAFRSEQPPECRSNIELGVLPLFLDFFACLQYLILTAWRCVTRCLGDDSDVIEGGGGLGPTATRGAPKGKKGGEGGKGGKANGVKYSAVDAEEDELFEAGALEGDEERGGGGAMRTLNALSGSSDFNLPAEEEVEMMDMLDATQKKAAAGAMGGEQKVGGGKVPSLLPPPSVAPATEGKEAKKAAEAEDEDADGDYDYGDIEEEEEAEEVEPM